MLMQIWFSEMMYVFYVINKHQMAGLDTYQTHSHTSKTYTSFNSNFTLISITFYNSRKNENYSCNIPSHCWWWSYSIPSRDGGMEKFRDDSPPQSWWCSSRSSTELWTEMASQFSRGVRPSGHPHSPYHLFEYKPYSIQR